MERVVSIDRVNNLVKKSDFISRDLSWLKFNHRVLDQARHLDRNIFERLKFMAITASNLDEFFMIRIGSLYNYIDYGKERIDYSGLRELPFRKKLLTEAQDFVRAQNEYFIKRLRPLFAENQFKIAKISDLDEDQKEKVKNYFRKTIFPMLTPMVYDSYHTFPILMNKLLIFGVVTVSQTDKKDQKKLSFIQVPQNLPRFYEIEHNGEILFVPIEEIIREHIAKLFRNIEIQSVNLFRIIRNGDFTLEESDDIEANFLEELKRKLKTRKTGRVVRIEVEETCDRWMLRILKNRWEIDEDNVFRAPEGGMIDLTGLWSIVNHTEFKDRMPDRHPQVPPLSYSEQGETDIYEVLDDRDILLHHPYNSIEPLLELLDRAADDPDVLSIKLTIYRLAKESRVTNALLRAAENGKHISVLFEVKARFDEENNMREARRLQKAGCFVIYGISSFKTHTKLMLIVRQVEEKVTRYVHMSSGNYNEDTARLYTDLGLLTTNEQVCNDVSEFFNAITGHSIPTIYRNLITAPRDMRQQLIELIRKEADNARQGKASGIVIKINSLEDRETIAELYAASQAGVKIKLIIRGICCLRPNRPGLSENIEVGSIVGDFLEHSRIYYFHNDNDPILYSGSADVMVRSFDRRIESLFLVQNSLLKQQVINILRYNLRDNVNAYIMNEDGSYTIKESTGEPPFNIHKEFYEVTLDDIQDAKLF
ncbi:polyphosphate kinase 1 [Roseivirga sp. BDSF3-8]|uniref:polyphosphate kinase 1 n=1 Tax=Roseivirga sp. BDSF3-8 TaxID=3241598 RepID=UPI003531E457